MRSTVTKVTQTYRLSASIPVLFVAIAMFATQALGQERKASFIDEGPKEPTFVSYRDTLLEAIAARDVDTVVASAAPDIQLDFGGGEGRDEFRKRLTVTADDLSEEYAHLADEHREQYWDALEEVLRLGGVFKDQGVFVAPYTWSVKLGDDEDAFAVGFVIGSDVPLRTRPSRFGDVITILDEDIVRVLDGGAGTQYIEVQVPDGQRGFVHRDQIRSAIDYRAIFQNTDGRWLMTTFIAGD